MKCILVVLILLSISGTLVFCNTIDEDINNLKSTQFGQTILETIQMQLETDNPVQNLVQMLQNIDLQLEAEQRRDDETHDRIQQNCENDTNNLQKIMGESTTRSKVLKTQLDQLNPQKTQKVADLNRKNQELDDLRTELDKQADNRKMEQEIYEKTLDDLEASLFAVNSAKKMFNDFLDILLKNKKKFAKPDSFLQNKNSRFNQVEEVENDQRDYDFDFDDEHTITNLAQVSHHLSKLKHNIKDEGPKIMIQALAHISNQIKQNPAEEQENLCRKIITIINQLANYIQKTRMNEDQAEQARKEAFIQLEQMFTDQIVFTQKEQNALQGSIESLSNQITGASNEKFEVDQKMTVKENEMNDRETECRNEAIDYNSEKNKRDAERQALALALDIITTKLGQLKKQILEKGL